MSQRTPRGPKKLLARPRTGVVPGSSVAAAKGFRTSTYLEADEDGLEAFAARGRAAQAAVDALGAGDRTAVVLGALRALAEAIIDCEDRILAPHSLAQGGVEIPGKVWERIVDLARRVP